MRFHYLFVKQRMSRTDIAKYFRTTVMELSGIACGNYFLFARLWRNCIFISWIRFSEKYFVKIWRVTPFWYIRVQIYDIRTKKEKKRKIFNRKRIKLGNLLFRIEFEHTTAVRHARSLVEIKANDVQLNDEQRQFFKLVMAPSPIIQRS